MTNSFQPPGAKPGSWVTLMSAMIFLLSVVFVAPLASRIDPLVGDYLLFDVQAAAQQKPTDIVLVSITEETLAAFPYRSPIDREFLARLIRTIDAAGPKKIGVDILFDSPSEPNKDGDLIDALKHAAAPVILARATIEDGLTPAQSAYLIRLLDNALSGSIVLQRDEVDGVIRHVPRPVAFDGDPVLTFAETIAGKTSSVSGGRSRILYRYQNAESGVFPNYPAYAVSLLPAEWFKDKYVLIGVDLPGIDRHRTPLVAINGTERGSLPGTEIHAHLLSQILENRSLPVASGWQMLGLSVVFALLSMIGFYGISTPVRYFSVLVAGIVIYAFIVWVLLSDELVLLPIFGPVVAAVVAGLGLSIMRWWQDRSEKEFLKTAFSQYVSPSVVTKLTSGKINLALGGEKRRVTYLFTDLEGFTSLTETQPADEMGQLLNSYLDEIFELITDHGATIDKVVGDAVVCFFGAPDDDKDQAANGVKLAIAIDRFCEQFRKEKNSHGIPLGATRIGVHMGEATIGNFGGRRFFDYTGIGDTVNTAARLENANRYLHTRICVSLAVVRECTDYKFRPVGKLLLKGRSQALECFEPCAEDDVNTSWMQRYVIAYDALEKAPSQALELFEQAQIGNPNDGPTRFHVERLRQGNSGQVVQLGGK